MGIVVFEIFLTVDFVKIFFPFIILCGSVFTLDNWCFRAINKIDECVIF